MRLLGLQGSRLRRQAGIEGTALGQQPVAQATLPQCVGARLQRRAFLTVGQGLALLGQRGARLCRFANHTPRLGLDALACARLLLLRHIGLRQSSLRVGTAPCTAQGQRDVDPQHMLLPTALARGAHAHRGVGGPLQPHAFGLQACLPGLRLGQLQFVVVLKNARNPGSGRVLAVRTTLWHLGGPGGIGRRQQAGRVRQARVAAQQALANEHGLGSGARGLGLHAGMLCLGGEQFERGGIAQIHPALRGGQGARHQRLLGLQQLVRARGAQGLEPVRQQGARGLMPGVGLGKHGHLFNGRAQLAVGRHLAGPAHGCFQAQLGFRVARAALLTALVGTCLGYPVVRARAQAFATRLRQCQAGTGSAHLGQLHKDFLHGGGRRQYRPGHLLGARAAGQRNGAGQHREATDSGASHGRLPRRPKASKGAAQ